jgi:CHAT domain-containing protein
VLRDRRRAAEGSLKAAAQALSNRDLAGIGSALRPLWDATEASDDRVLMALRGHGHLVGGLGRMSTGEASSSLAAMLEACDVLLRLPPDADQLGLAHAIGEGSNRVYRRETHLHHTFNAKAFFETLLAHLVRETSAPQLKTEIQRGSTEDLLAQLARLPPHEQESIRILVGWLAFTCGLVATDNQQSADALRYYIQSVRLIEGLRNCPEACYALAQMVFPAMEFERLRHGDTVGAERAKERCAKLLIDVGVPATAREQLLRSWQEREKVDRALAKGDYVAASAAATPLVEGVPSQAARDFEQALAARAAGDFETAIALLSKHGGPGQQMSELVRATQLPPGSSRSISQLLPLAFSSDTQIAWRAAAFLGLSLDGTDNSFPQLAILFSKLSMRTLQRMRLELMQQRFAQLDPFYDDTAIKAAELLGDQLKTSGRLGEALRHSSLIESERSRVPPPKLVSIEPLVDASCPLTAPERRALEEFRKPGNDSPRTAEILLRECMRLEAVLRGTLAATQHLLQEDDAPLPSDAVRLAIGEDAQSVRATLSGRFGFRTETVRLSPRQLNAITFDAMRVLAEADAVPGAPLPALQALHEALVAPFVQTIEHTGAKVLLVQASGALRRIPFAVLHDGRRYLIERIAVVAHPGSIPLRPSRGMQTPVSAASIAVSEVPGLRPLPSVLLDSRELRRTVVGGGLGQVDALLDEDASAERVELLLATKPTLLHMSSHFEVDHADASRSAFLLAGGQRYTLAQLARQDLTSVDLALMLGCETQSVSEVDGAFGVTAIDSLLLRMGVGAVVGSAWSVRDDQAHAMLTRFLHEVFTQGSDLASALRTATLSIARDPVTGAMSHPHEWGAFVLSGDWSGAMGQVVDGLEAPI